MAVPPDGQGDRTIAPLVLIAATEAGYANLVRLVSRAYLDLPAGEAPHVNEQWLEGGG
jgi:DNA polymerase III subunit alpha